MSIAPKLLHINMTNIKMNEINMNEQIDSSVSFNYMIGADTD